VQADDQSGLVLGGGGITGIAWELGLLAGLAAASVDLLSADVIVGTSAGSVVGAQVTSSTPLEALYLRQLEPPSSELPARLGSREMLVYLAALLRARGDLTKFGRRLGAMSLKAAHAGRVPTVDQRLAVIKSRLQSTEWPERDFRVTVVDARSGEFRVITRADGVPLVDALAASCAVPGVYPPIPIGDRTYIDGGFRSSTNADLARGCAKLSCWPRWRERSGRSRVHSNSLTSSPSPRSWSFRIRPRVRRSVTTCLTRQHDGAPLRPAARKRQLSLSRSGLSGASANEPARPITRPDHHFRVSAQDALEQLQNLTSRRKRGSHHACRILVMHIYATWRAANSCPRASSACGGSPVRAAARTRQERPPGLRRSAPPHGKQKRPVWEKASRVNTCRDMTRR